MNTKLISILASGAAAIAGLSAGGQAHAGMLPLKPALANAMREPHVEAIVPSRCPCRARRHFHRYTYEPVEPAPAPLYPAPKVGFTFRKLFDAGYL